MSYEFQASSPEDLQNFTHGIIHSTSIEQGDGNVLHVQRATVDLESVQDRVFVSNKTNPHLEPVFGEPVLADLELGVGLDENGSPVEPTRLFVSRLDANSGKLFRELAKGAGYDKHNLPDPDEPHYVVGVRTPKGNRWPIEGYTIINPTIKFGVIGRETNLQWNDKDAEPLPKGQSPIKDPFVSRFQIDVTHTQKGLIVNGASENSVTRVTLAASDKHREIVEKNEAAKIQAEREAATRAHRGSKLRGILNI